MRWIVVIAAGVSALGAVAGRLDAADAKAAPAPAKASAARSATVLLEQGQLALGAEDYKAARDAFCDVLSIDPRNAMALEGATVSYCWLGDTPHAKADLEKLLTLNPHPSKAVVVNGASILLRQKNAMRAAKILMQYMQSQTSVDEEALDALAVALFQADEQSRKVGLFNTAVKFYMTNNEKLEATRPGMKRWGTTWLSADEAKRKNDEWNEASKKADDLSRQINQLNSELSNTQAQLEAWQKQQRVQGGAYVANRVNLLQGQVNELQSQLQSRQSDYEHVLDGHERPPIPKTIPLLAVAAPNPQYASADSTGAGTTGVRSPSAPSTDSGDSSPPPSSPSSTDPPASTSTPPGPSDPTPAPPADPQRKVRIPVYAAAFAVGPDLLVTSAQAVADVSEIQVQISDGTPFKASVLRTGGENGLALLRVDGAKLSYLELGSRFPGGALNCVSFPNVNIFQPQASLIAGSAVAPKGAAWAVRLSHPPRLPGGPLLFEGKVVGVELASRDSELDAIPAASLDDLRTLLGADAPASGQGTAEPVAVTLQVSAIREK